MKMVTREEQHCINSAGLLPVQSTGEICALATEFETETLFQEVRSWTALSEDPDKERLESDACGVLDFSWDSRGLDGVSIDSCNDAMLALLGFASEDIEANRQRVVLCANLTIGKTIAQLIHVDEAFQTTQRRRGILRRIDGTLVDVSYWQYRKSDLPRSYTLVCYPTPLQEIAARDLSLRQFIDGMKSVYDVIIEVNTLRGLARCVHNANPYDGPPSNSIPYKLDNALESWVQSYLTPDSQPRFTECFNAVLSSLPGSLPSQSKHFSCQAAIEGEERPIDVFLHREEEELLVLIKLLGERNEPKFPRKHVRITTFGYFEVYVDGVPVVFKHPKARELFAILVDRKGAAVSGREAASMLWPKETLDKKVMARYRKVSLLLSASLSGVGISHVVQMVGRSRCIVPSLVECDLYECLDGEKDASPMFFGYYMRNYPWANLTYGELAYLNERAS